MKHSLNIDLKHRCFHRGTKKRRHSLSMKNLMKKTNLLIGLLLALFAYNVLAQSAKPERPPIEDRRYEDWFTFKYGESFPRDDWTWGYTQEFADRFRMPEKWIEPGLKGVLAVAFRMGATGKTMCGLGGNEDNCWPSLECRLDVYYDNRIPLPWNHPEIKKDSFIGGIWSYEYLHRDEKGQGYLKYRDPKYPDEPMSTGVGINLAIGGNNIRGFSTITYFNQELFPDVGLIGSEGISVCSTAAAKATSYFGASFVLTHEAEAIEKKPKHKFEVPASFMERAHAAYVRDNKSNDEIKKRLIQQFIDSRKK